MSEPAELDPNMLLRDIIMPVAAAVVPAVKVVERLMADRAKFYPVVRGYRWGGAWVTPGLLDRAICDVHVFDGDRDRAIAMAQAIRTGLYRAWLQQTVYEHGSISQFLEILAPSEPEVPNRLAGETWIQATYQLHMCPPSF